MGSRLHFLHRSTLNGKHHYYNNLNDPAWFLPMHFAFSCSDVNKILWEHLNTKRQNAWFLPMHFAFSCSDVPKVAYSPTDLSPQTHYQCPKDHPRDFGRLKRLCHPNRTDDSLLS